MAICPINCAELAIWPFGRAPFCCCCCCCFSFWFCFGFVLFCFVLLFLFCCFVVLLFLFFAIFCFRFLFFLFLLLSYLKTKIIWVVNQNTSFKLLIISQEHLSKCQTLHACEMPPPAAESFQAWILSSDKGERYWNHRMRKKKLTGLGIDPVAYQVLMQDDFVQTKCRNFVNIITRGPEPITTSKRRKRKYHQSKRFNLPFYIFQTNQKLDNTRGRYAGSCSDWSMKPGETLDFCVSEYCVNCPICDLIGP